MQSTITVPEWVIQALQFLNRNDIALIGVFVVAVLGSIATEVIKRNRNAKRLANGLEKLEDWAVVKLFVVTNLVFTTAGYVYFFGSQHSSFLASLPYIGQGTGEVTTIAFIIYHWKGREKFNAFAAWYLKRKAARQAKKKDRTSDDTILTAETPVFTGSPLPAPTDPNPFEG
jgi:hypothetical protein